MPPSHSDLGTGTIPTWVPAWFSPPDDMNTTRSRPPALNTLNPDPALVALRARIRAWFDSRPRHVAQAAPGPRRRSPPTASSSWPTSAFPPSGCGTPWAGRPPRWRLPSGASGGSWPVHRDDRV